MSEDLILEPELLPPMPLAPLAAKPASLRLAAVGAALLAMAGVWGAAASPFAQAAGLQPGAPPKAPVQAAAPIARAAPALVALVPLTLAPVTLADVAAGQPSALSLPAGGDQASDTPAVGLNAGGAGQ